MLSLPNCASCKMRQLGRQSSVCNVKMENYTKGAVLGRGTFGEVIKAIHKETGQVVAIKKIRIGEKGEGVNVTALREVKFLRELNDPHIVRLLDVFPQKRGISLVFEFMETDLEYIIKDRSRVLSAADIKAYMQMVLRALALCHARWIVHRDIKPNNFLVSATGELKLADFGLARLYGSPERKYTNQVFARWYRPPELFYGSTCYGPSVDVWAAGCVFAELMLRRPWFPGESDTDVLAKIFMNLGTPTDEWWGGLRNMPSFVEFTPTPPPGLKTIFRGASEDALDLLARMMAFDASRRITAAEALQHRYFRVDPLPTPPDRLPRPQQLQQAQQAQGQPAALAAEKQQQPAVPGALQRAQEAHPLVAPLTDMPPPPNRPRDSIDPGQPTGMTSVVRKMALSTGGPLKRVKAADGSAVPSGGGGLQEGFTPQDAALADGPPESALGQVARPKLDSSDIKFLKKRKMQLDEAFEEAGQEGGDSEEGL